MNKIDSVPFTDMLTVQELSRFVPSNTSEPNNGKQKGKKKKGKAKQMKDACKKKKK